MTTRVRMDPTAPAKIRAAADRYRARLLYEIAADASRNAPRDTGELANSIEARPAEGTVVATSDHATYVELGTRHMRAHPYLRPALYQRRGGAR